MAPTSDGGGYWLVAADGGVFASGTPTSSAPRVAAPRPRRSSASPRRPAARGYWLVAADGGVFAFGDADFLGSDPGRGIRTPAVGIIATGNGDGGYTVILSNGQVANYGPLGVLTPNGSPYTYNESGAGTVTVSASSATGGNDREFSGTTAVRRKRTRRCAQRFASGQGNDQQGLVLRLNDVDGVYTGITVMRNVYLGLFDLFNFHTWNTDPAFEAGNSGSPFLKFGSTFIPGLPVAPAVYPLDMCARTVTSQNIIQFVLWTPGIRAASLGLHHPGRPAADPVRCSRHRKGGLVCRARRPRHVDRVHGHDGRRSGPPGRCHSLNPKGQRICDQPGVRSYAEAPPRAWVTVPCWMASRPSRVVT